MRTEVVPVQLNLINENDNLYYNYNAFRNPRCFNEQSNRPRFFGEKFIKNAPPSFPKSRNGSDSATVYNKGQTSFVDPFNISRLLLARADANQF